MHKIMMIMVCSLILGACGVKPGAPEGSPDHPRTYPDIRVDTTPHGNTVRP